MPSRNIEKIFIPDAYYHVYNRGVNRRKIFLDEEDYAVFLNLLKRYLSKEPVKDKKGREYPWLYNDLELLAYCLMPNHFHLLFFQLEEQAITTLLRGVCTAYTRHFNQKYQRVGHLFQDRFKASLISNDSYLHHISRYIHLNPEEYEMWPFSSLPHYLQIKKAEWVRPERLMDDFPPDEYRKFLREYFEKREQDIETEAAFTELANAQEE